MEKVAPPGVTFLDGASEEGRFTHDSNVQEPVSNRTLYMNNLGLLPRNPLANLTGSYEDIATVCFITLFI